MPYRPLSWPFFCISMRVYIECNKKKDNINMNFNKFLLVGLFILASVTASKIASAQDVNVDVELQLLLDTSGSISNSEYDLQMDGYSYAFNDQSIRDLILDSSGDKYGQIAVQTVMWSSSNRQQITGDWMLLDSNSAIDSFVSNLASTSRPFSGGTYTGEALDFGSTLFADNGFNGTRNVVDISGDGYSTGYLYDYYYGEGTADGMGITDTAEARDRMLDNGIDTINGITITYDYDQTDIDLTSWYSQNVIGGQDAFVIQAGDFTDFRAALTTKLAAEIEGGYIPENAIAPNEVYSAPAPILGQGLAGLLFGLICFFRRKIC